MGDNIKMDLRLCAGRFVDWIGSEYGPMVNIVLNSQIPYKSENLLISWTLQEELCSTEHCYIVKLANI
jgi:hypothetical protein